MVFGAADGERLTGPVELTILMPCLNEAQTIGRCIEKAKRFAVRCSVVTEILVADNGSTDGSQQIAVDLGARVIAVPRRGYGNALRSGIAAARGRFIIMGDGDDSYDFSRLDGFIERLREGADLVMGDRFKGGIAKDAMPLHHRLLGNPVLSFIGRLLYSTPVRDFHCGLRGFSRQAIQGLDLVCEGMEFASEMVVKAALHGLKIKEVPTTLAKDGRDRPPHLRSFRDGWRHLSFLLVHCPRWLFLYPALTLFAVGVALQAMIFTGPLKVGAASLDIHSMLVAALMSVISLQLCLFWVLAQYVAWVGGVLPTIPPAARFLGEQRLEAGLLIGSALVVLGVALGIYETWQWTSAGFGGLDPAITMRALIPSTTAVLAGAQLFMASFFLQIIRMSERRARELDSVRPTRAAVAEDASVHASRTLA